MLMHPALRLLSATRYVPPDQGILISAYITLPPDNPQTLY